MPELPETETIARDLDRSIGGSTIAGVRVPRPDVLRETSASTLGRRARGATITKSWRRAKLVVLDLSTGDRIVVQPRFTGALLVDDGSLDARAREYTAVELALADGRVLRYRDVRRLGTVSLMSPVRFSAYAAALGPEPLDPGFTSAHLSALLRGSNQAVKKLIMDQRRLAGVGNIYANEALWRARIDPSRHAASLAPDQVAALHHGIVTVLTEAIAARGTTFRDFQDARGEPGGFAASLRVYGRGGEPCPRCGARLILTYAIDGRASVLCARCQS
jgi:formamidopyrimidine-DNA glycosylase